MLVEYSTGRAAETDIRAHLTQCDSAFIPTLSSRVDIGGYARRIVDGAQCFEAWSNDELIGLVAVYCNDPGKRTAFITSVSVMPAWQGKRIASRLIAQCIAHVHGLGFENMELEVGGNNEAAIALYAKHGFTTMGQPGPIQKMTTAFRKEA
jgi:ribosomal protein S18 acetylase RimI-like enzyme